ncbi:hypothetical protein J53TS2_29580 [Paenibacillus sp. J53TS2]|uniref:hypothetical protein n=1 Tax=Paenibacillus sp. J53TS2 TaxID=2807197 RepID=UPI001B093C01|nr:hypothetical protein [Paenibacillus sp. J53TS2]GIP49367.1 hypothetical protein J53TS2_29580 [Paenibacillus sp. J53TS2]
MEENIKSLLSSLSWNCPQDEQEIAVMKIINLKDKIPNCLITNTSKDQWDNCMKIINKLDYKDQLKMTPQMLFLLKDMNWPGAQEACNLMCTMNTDDLIPYIMQALEQADTECDTIWITWIKKFLEKLNQNEIIITNIEIFKHAEW